VTLRCACSVASIDSGLHGGVAPKNNVNWAAGWSPREAIAGGIHADGQSSAIVVTAVNSLEFFVTRGA
jgi:hypothetical protein